MDVLLQDDALVKALRRAHPGDDIAEVAARVAWNVLVEPGDAVAGALIAELGAEEALRFAFADDGGSLAYQRRSRALRDALGRWRPRASVDAVRSAVTDAEHVAATLLLPGDGLWPESLDDLGHHAPTMLWVRGDAAVLTASPRASIVGARASSTYGELLASEFAGDLAVSGVVIVSGGV